MTIRGAAYKRISSDREGLEAGVNRQHEDIFKRAGELGITISPKHDYVDNDLSASTRSRKPRPAYQRMIAAAKAGEFDVVLAYTTSRLTRKPREHEDLIELSERHGIKFQYVKSPSFDLNTAAGRQIARHLAAADAGEAEATSERVKRAVEDRVKGMRWHGGTAPMGYRTVTEMIGGQLKVVRLEPDPETSALVQEAVAKLLSGSKLYGICNEWNARGLHTPAGSRWAARTLRIALTTPSICGERVYQGATYKAAWEPIIEKPTWERVQVLLTRTKRTTKGTGYTGSRPLRGLVYCECGFRMVGQTTTAGAPRLICVKQYGNFEACGKCAVPYQRLEDFIVAGLFDPAHGYLSSDVFRQALAQRQRQLPDSIEAGLRDELDALDDQRRGVGRAVMLGAYTDAEAAIELEEITKRRDEVENAQKALQESRPFIEITDAKAGLKLWLASEDVTRRHRLLSVFIERIVIGPYPKGKPRSLVRRKSEDDQAYAARKYEHEREMLRQRVDITWRKPQ